MRSEQTQTLPLRPISRKCANCGLREGTIRWGDALSLSHGFADLWCKVCALTAQLAHAEERAALIPELRAQLAEATTASVSSGDA